MNRKIALRWARALESGEYNQATGRLRDSKNRFCCLGVLCNLHAQAHPEIAAEQTDASEYMGEAMSLPIPVMEWSGISWSEAAGFGPAFSLEIDDGKHDKYAIDLMGLNDTYGYNFKQIAAVIREHSDKL